MPALICIDVHSTVNPACCIALGTGLVGPDHSGFPGKTHPILVPVMQTCSIFILFLFNFCRESGKDS